MKLRWKPILILVGIVVVLGSAIGIGFHVFEQYKLNQVGFELTRVEVDTIYDFRYRAMFKIYFYIENDGEEKRVQLKLYMHEEHGDAIIDSRFWNIRQDTKWISMKFYKGENETSLQKHLYRLTAQRTEMWTDEPLSNEVTVWDGRTSDLPLLPFKQTFGIEVTKFEIGEYSTYEGFTTKKPLRNYTLRFYIFNHEEAQNIEFELYREYYDESRLHSSEVTDSGCFYIEHGDAGYIELKAGASELHEPTLDLRYYKLKANAEPYTLWYGKDEEPIVVED